MFRHTLEERKNRILKAAAKVFAGKGYKTATLQDVANKAGISKAGIFHYFDTKEKILYHIIKNANDTFLRVLKDCIEECEKKKLEPEDAFKALVSAYASFLNKEKEIRLIILRERHQLTGKFKKRLHKIEQDIFRLLKTELEKIPHISRKYDPNLVSFQIIAMSHWLGYWLKDKGELTLESAIDQNIDIIFNGILKKRP